MNNIPSERYEKKSAESNIPELKLEYIGGVCPVQAEGTITGIPFYFRARGKGWQFGAGKDPVSVAMGSAEGFQLEEYEYEKYAAGWMEVDTAMEIIEKCVREFLTKTRSF